MPKTVHWKLALFSMALCLFLVGGCKNETEQPTISPEKAAQMLADFAIADAACHGLSGSPRDSLSQLYFKQVLEMHGLQREEYEKNIQVFSQNEEQMKSILKASEEVLKGRQKKDSGGK